MAEAALTPAAEPETIHPEQPVSIEIGDQVFTGVGETEASLREGLDLPTPATPTERPKRGQRRIDQLSYEVSEERRQREAVERERDELRARLEQPRPASPPPEPVARPSQPTYQQQQAARVAVPFAFPKFDDWMTQHPESANAADVYELWQDAKTDARTDWKLQTGQFVPASELDARIRQSIEADRASRTFVEQVNATRADARKVHPDFDAVLKSVDDIQFPGPILELIAGLPNSGLLQYRLASNRSLAQEIAQSRDLGTAGFKLAQLMADPAVAPSASTADPVVYVLPPPMQPVGSGSKTTVLSASDLADRAGEDYDSSGFREQARKERGRR